MLPSERFVDFLRGKFADAYGAQDSKDIRGGFNPNGSFVRINPLPRRGEGEVTRSTYRIVLKKPHPNDTPGTFCEVYVMDEGSPDGEALPEVGSDHPIPTPGINADTFFLIDFTHGRAGYPWIVTEFGVERLPSPDTVAELEGVTDAPTLPLIGVEPVLETGNPMEVAESMYKKYEHYNIVPASD